jgi:hypothetical protein
MRLFQRMFKKYWFAPTQVDIGYKKIILPIPSSGQQAQVLRSPLPCKTYASGVKRFSHC